MCAACCLFPPRSPKASPTPKNAGHTLVEANGTTLAQGENGVNSTPTGSELRIVVEVLKPDVHGDGIGKSDTGNTIGYVRVCSVV